MAIFNKFQRAKQVAEILLRYGLDEFFERSCCRSRILRNVTAKCEKFKILQVSHL